MAARCRAIAVRWRCCRSDLGIAILWNSERACSSGLLPTIIDSALASGGQWLMRTWQHRNDDVRHSGTPAGGGLGVDVAE
jgi:hypothetical protein